MKSGKRIWKSGEGEGVDATYVLQGHGMHHQHKYEVPGHWKTLWKSKKATNVPTYCWYGSGPVWAQAEGSQLRRAHGHGGLSWSQGRHCKKKWKWNWMLWTTSESEIESEKGSEEHMGTGTWVDLKVGTAKRIIKKLDVMNNKWKWKWKGLRRAHGHGDLSWSQGRHCKILWYIMMIKSESDIANESESEKG